MNLYFGVEIRFQALDEYQIDRFHMSKQNGKARARSLDLVQQGPSASRGDQNLMRPRETMPMAVLPRLVHIETAFGVFDGGDRQAHRAQKRQKRDHQCRLPAARPTDDAQNFQKADFTFRSPPLTWRARHRTAALGIGNFRRGSMPQTGDQIVPSGHQSQHRGDPKHGLANP